MKELKYILILGIVFLFTFTAVAQEPDSKDISKKISEPSSADTQIVPVSSERRKQALAKLVEGQRYIWSMSHLRGTNIIKTSYRLAKESLEKAVELDPNLSEGYTALAELSYFIRPRDLSEAIKNAKIATSINPDNFGGHQILAYIYTEKSRINRGVLDAESAQKAVEEWKEVVRLDPRNAEGHAFLSAFYGEMDKTKEQIEALRNWISSATPLGSRFYQRMLGRREQLTPESAMVKLGAVLIREKKPGEAVEVLSRAIAENPDNEETIELLSQALESADDKTIAKAIEALQQAVFANPDNESLITMLAQVQARTGDIDSAAKTLRDSIQKLNENDKAAAANLQIILGDIFQEVRRFEEAAANYKTALAIRGIAANRLIRQEDRDFAMRVYEKLIETYKNAKRPDDVRDVINKARILFGDNELFAEKS